MEDFIVPINQIKRAKNLKRGKRVIDISKFKLGTRVSSADIPDYLREKTLLGNFDSLAEYFTLIKGPFNSTDGLRYDSSSDKHRGSDWVVYETYDEALNVMTTKPQELVKFKSNELELNDGEESGREVNFDVTGDFLDVGRYLDGVPEVFGYNHDGKHRGKRVKILMSGNAACTTDARALVERSKRLSRLVDWLEYQGVRVGLNVIFSNDNAHSEIKIKDFQDPLSISDVAISTHGDFFRRFDFRFKEHSQTIDGGYGYSHEFPRWIRYNQNKYDNQLPLGEYFIFIDGSRAVEGVKYVTQLFDNIEEDIKKSIEMGVDGKQVLVFA